MRISTWFALTAAALAAAASVSGCSVPATPAAAPAAPSTPATPATPPANGQSGVTAKEVSRATVDGKDYVVRQLTIAPGGATGWHYHDGEVNGWVVSGTLTHFDHGCKVDGVYKVGQSISEPSGQDKQHMGRNAGTEPMVLDVVYVLPSGSPLAEIVPPPACDHS